MAHDMARERRKKGHIVSAFDDDLRSLAASISVMGGIAESMVRDVMAALLDADSKLALDVIHRDGELNEHRNGVERDAANVIALRQPLARDLRDVLSAMRVAGELERVGDLAKNNARRVHTINRSSLDAQLSNEMERMSQLVQEQLSNALNAFATLGTDLAHKVCAGDDAVDALYASLTRDVINRLGDTPAQGHTHAKGHAQLLFWIKNLERTSDHATNMAENVIYMVTGKKPRDGGPEIRSGPDA